MNAINPDIALVQTDGPIRPDLRLIAEMVPQGARVLDIGCGDGALLEYLVRHKGVDGRGIELNQERVAVGIGRGLAVIQGDADTDLDDYPEGAFDLCILSQTIQATRAPDKVLANLVRIGKAAIVSLPNFGSWRMRLSLLLNGRMPVTRTLPNSWYETQNIHFCTVRDFVTLCHDLGIRIEQSEGLDPRGRICSRDATRGLANLRCDQAIFLLSKR
ncbi:MAG: methionine biosynthesis protein MetW [Alphaproteobacteria bacterium]